MLRPTDLVAIAAHNATAHPNEAVAFAHLAHPPGWERDWPRMAQAAWLPFRRRRYWIGREGLTLRGLVAVRQRSGREVWEIDTLISPAPAEVFLLDLLDRAVATAGAEGAERLFLRVRADSPALDAARHHGFVLVQEETLFRAPAASGEPAGAAPQARQRRDDQALFRLYDTATPHEVRWHTALSPREWRAAEEPLGRHARQWVLPGIDPEQPVRALIRMSGGSRGTVASLLTDGAPETERTALAMLAAARPLLVLLTPTYARSRRSAAAAAGFQPVQRYALLSRAIAQRAQRLRVAERAVEGAVSPVVPS